MDAASNQLLLELANRYQISLDASDPLRSPLGAGSYSAAANVTPGTAGAAANAVLRAAAAAHDDSGSEADAPNLSGTISEFSESADTSSAGDGPIDLTTPAGAGGTGGRRRRTNQSANSAFSPAGSIAGSAGGAGGAGADRKTPAAAAAPLDSTAPITGSGGAAIASRTTPSGSVGRSAKLISRRSKPSASGGNSLLVAEIERIQSQLNDRDRTYAHSADREARRWPDRVGLTDDGMWLVYGCGGGVQNI